MAVIVQRHVDGTVSIPFRDFAPDEAPVAPHIVAFSKFTDQQARAAQEALRAVDPAAANDLAMVRRIVLVGGDLRLAVRRPRVAAQPEWKDRPWSHIRNQSETVLQFITDYVPLDRAGLDLLRGPEDAECRRREHLEEEFQTKSAAEGIQREKERRAQAASEEAARKKEEQLRQQYDAHGWETLSGAPAAQAFYLMAIRAADRGDAPLASDFRDLASQLATASTRANGRGLAWPRREWRR